MSKSGFTLIELLIVVAIIAILAAIAVPNFLEAQTRSKVSRVQADIRSIATAVESYCIDNNKYPRGWAEGLQPRMARLAQLTTPIAYISSIPIDIFNVDYILNIVDQQAWRTYVYWSPADVKQELINDPINPYQIVKIGQWNLRSYGPDKYWGNAVTPKATWIPYDSTNGTISGGDIIRSGP